VAVALTLPQSRATSLAGTAAAALAGGALVGGLGAPAGWLSGAMLGVAGLAAFRAAAPLPKPAQRLTVLLTGVGVGSGLSPQTLHSLARYPLSLALLAAAVATMTAASYFALMRTQRFDRPTAFYAAAPGALSYVFLVASRTEADLARVAVIQVFRLFVLMAIVPLVARLGVGPSVARFATDPLLTTAALVVLSAAAGAALERLGVPNGSLYAAILVSGAAHVSGLAPGRLAPDLQIFAQVLVGAWVGSRFIGFDWSLLRRLVSAAATSFGAAFAVAAAFSGLAVPLTGVSFADALAAFAPGGLEAMTMMAFALGLDPLFVGAHHIARFLFISFALPWVARRIA
jgi:membrane AbrB-like protein